MPDARRRSFAPAGQDADAADGASRESQMDALLEDGLEQYFSGRFEDAIHLWTRVLFFDRTHARARAYIDRARTALAEQHRRSEELLQSSRELLNQGQTDAARRLLTEAVAARGDEIQAAALGAHLDRVERARGTIPARVMHPPVADPIPGWSWHRTSPGMLGGVLVAVLTVTLGGIALVSVTDPSDALPALKPSTAETGLPVLSSSEVALVRARTAFSGGRLAEALQKLDRVGPDSPQREAADALRTEIQQLLLASVRPSSPSLEAIRR